MAIDRDEQFRVVAEGMIASGVERMQACAMAAALIFAADSKEFTAQYGTFHQEQLEEALQEICNKV